MNRDGTPTCGGDGARAALAVPSLPAPEPRVTEAMVEAAWKTFQDNWPYGHGASTTTNSWVRHALGAALRAALGSHA